MNLRTWWATFFFTAPKSHVVVVPGFGGSVLRTVEKKTNVWPPFPVPSFQQSKALDVEWIPGRGMQSLLPLETLPTGDCAGIRVDTPLTYVFTKNSFYYPLLQQLQRHNAAVSALPYDFRLMDDKKIGDDYLHFFESNPQKWVVICHSLGGLVFHHFLVTRTDESWQQKHLSRVYFINVPFGGCPESLFTIRKSVRGEGPFRVPLLPLRVDTMHHFVGLYWCLPVMQTGDPILRKSASMASYTDKDFVDIFHGTPVASQLYRDILERMVVHRQKPLAVPTFIVYGSNISTPVFLDESTSTRLFENGDGIVPLSSLLFPRRYFRKDHTYYIEVKGMAHDRVVDCLGLFDFVGKNALAPRNSTWELL